MAITGQITVDRDHVLVERHLAGERDAFDELFARHRDKVYAIALGVVGNPDDALDVLQETFTSVHRHVRTFDRRARFSTWLYRVAVNAAIGATRKKKARPPTVPLGEALAAPAVSSDGLNGDPVIHQALAELTPNDRALLTLFYWDDLPLEEIAGIVGCSANAAKTRLFRARERFKERYTALNGEAAR
jgi:RNA polymerase sigma-70 factor (ECF subfamily)